MACSPVLGRGRVAAYRDHQQRTISQVQADPQRARHERVTGDVAQEESTDQCVLTLGRARPAFTGPEEGDGNTVGGTVDRITCGPDDRLTAVQDVQPSPPLTPQHHRLAGAVVGVVGIAAAGGGRVMVDPGVSFPLPQHQVTIDRAARVSHDLPRGVLEHHRSVHFGGQRVGEMHVVPPGQQQLHEGRVETFVGAEVEDTLIDDRLVDLC